MEWKEEDKNMTGVFHHNKINENTTATPPNLSEMEPSKSNSSVVSKPTQTNVDQFDSGQNLPKKKKGFKITRVTEVDGDDSADELEDPSGDVSSINITQDVHSLIFGDESALSSNTYSLTEATSEKSQNTQQNYFTTNSTFVSVPQASREVAQEFEVKSRAGSLVSVSNEHSSESAHNLPIVDKCNAPGHSSTKSVQSPVTVSESVSNEVTKANVAITAITTTPSKPGASRIYKVVKRESIFPDRRDASRWVCFDFSDIQTANSTFVNQSSNESRSNLHDSLQSHQFLNVASTTIPLNQSYQSQFADVPAHYLKDYKYLGNSMLSNEVMPHSESTSSVYHDGDGQRIVTALKPVIEMTNELMRRQVLSDDSRVSEASSSDQDILKSAPDTEDDSISAHFRIDTKIEAAMDLVKKHLMLAVRDEVDELKDRIVELQTENEAMRNLLSPEQLTRVQSNYNQLMKRSHSVSKANRLNQSFRQSTSNVLSHSFSIDSTSVSSAYEQLPLSAKQNVYSTTTQRGSISSAVTSRNLSVVQNTGTQPPLHSQATYVQPNPTIGRQTSAPGHLPRSMPYQHQGPPSYPSAQGNKYPAPLSNQSVLGVRQPYQISTSVQGLSGSHSPSPRSTTGQYQSVYAPSGHGPTSTASGAQERVFQFSPTSIHTSAHSNASLNQRPPAPQTSNPSTMNPTTPHSVGHAQVPVGSGVVASPLDHT